MLTLKRGPGEKVRLTVPPSTTETLIEVVMVKTQQNRAYLGFQAPDSTKILRQEVYEDAAKRLRDSETEPGIGEDYA